MGKQKGKPLHNQAEYHPYIYLFNRHLGRIQDHLGGVSKQYASVSSLIGGVLWTSVEKDAFFHALSIYTRYRTDLIAGCIGTKNQVEVLEYLALLEEGSRRHEPEVPHRPGLPFAHEVSDAWASWEEQNAAQLQANEEIWTAQAETNLERTQGQALEHGTEAPQIKDTPPSPTCLGGVKHLTYGHLFVLDSISKGAQNKQIESGKETTLSILSVTPFVLEYRAKV